MGRPIVVVLALMIVVAATERIEAHPPSGIVVDEKGRVYFQDGKEGVWRVEEAGKLTLINKSAMHWMAMDVEGRFAQAEEAFGKWFGRITPKGEKPALISCSDFPVVMGKDGNLYYADLHGLTIKRRTPEGRESVLVEREKFRFNEKRPGGVNGLACGPDGMIYLVALDSINKREGSGEHVLYSVGMNGAITELARDFVKELLAESERHGEVRPQYTRDLAVDENGSVYIAVTGNRCVMKRTGAGEWSVVLRSEKPWTPTGVDVRNGEVYVLEYDDETPTEGRNWPPRVRKVGKDGKVTVVAEVRAKKEGA